MMLRPIQCDHISAYAYLHRHGEAQHGPAAVMTCGQNKSACNKGAFPQLRINVTEPWFGKACGEVKVGIPACINPFYHGGLCSAMYG